MKWSDSFSVGVEEIDRQHKRFFELVNQFHERMDAGDPSAPKKLLVDLADYASCHFETEEKYFDLFQYPDAEPHLIQHQEFRSRVRGFQAGYRLKGTFNIPVISEFLKKWMIDHILLYDRKYAGCFKKHRIC